jgi:phosphoglycerate dehydrogenase-like enzyme
MLVLSTQRFPAADVARLEAAGCTYRYVPPGGDPHGASSEQFHAGIYALEQAVRGEAAVLVTPCFHVTPHLLDALPALQWVHHPGAGVNSGSFWTQWDLLDAHHIVVTTAKIHAAPISEWIVAVMLALAKNLKRHAERQRAHIYHDEEHLPSLILEGKTALVIGAGHVGAETGRKLKLAFGMRTLGVNSDGRPVPYFDETHTLAALDELLPRADFVICTSVLVEDTRGMIDARRLALMRPSAYIINPSRGSLIVEEDLIAALQARRIAGAGLDTFEVEPLSADSPLWDLQNVVLTPHCSGGRPDYATAVMDRLLANLDAFRAGRRDQMSEVANIKRY